MIKDIINNKNLIYDLKKDIIFKKEFLDERNINYLKTLIICLFNINIDNIKLANAEIPNSIINKKSSYADLILKDDNNNEFIIEMNYIYSKSLHYKNYHYLLKEHTKRSHKNNMYGANNNTILINIDNYNELKENDLTYEIEFKDNKYNKKVYKNIKCIHINLDYLRNRYYNNYRLNKLEKLLLIFIEQRKDKLLSITNNKHVKELIDYMDYLKIGDDYITVYDRDEFEKAVKEEFENDKKQLESDKTRFRKEKLKFENNKVKLEKDKTEFENDKTEFENDKIEFENNRIKFEENKKNLAKELKVLGIPLKKIQELTKLSINEITLL